MTDEELVVALNSYDNYHLRNFLHKEIRQFSELEYKKLPCQAGIETSLRKLNELYEHKFDDIVYDYLISELDYKIESLNIRIDKLVKNKNEYEKRKKELKNEDSRCC